MSGVHAHLKQDAGERAIAMLEECEMKEHIRRLRSQWRTYDEYAEVMMSVYGKKDVSEYIDYG